MSHQVLMLEEAEEDLVRIFQYIARHDSPNRARYVFDKLEEVCFSLQNLPERGHVPPELEAFDMSSFREIHFKPYRIIYEVSGGTVYIHSVFDGRRDLQDLLESRLLR